jgi:formylglycine-generating enzyme required for sulfatase activity
MGQFSRPERLHGDSWRRRFGAALERYLHMNFFLYDSARMRALRERELALLVAPPLAERFPQRLADLGYVRHSVEAAGGDGWYITPPLCQVGAGPFLMGSDPQKDAETEDNELPQHTVATDAYQIGTYPVTVAEFDCAVRAGVVPEPRYNLDTWTYQLQWLDDPVTCISWADATAYAAWLARLTGQAWRLPTEAEWEKAARGADGRIYPWGDQWDDARANANLDNGNYGPTPVGAFAAWGDASPYGTHDLAGNVAEWTSSLFRPYPYAADDGREDPTAAGQRVMRGASWGNPPLDARSAARNGTAPAEPDDAMGFRLALAGGTESRIS